MVDNTEEMSNENKLTSRQRFHQAHRDEEEYMEKQREQRKASYYRNQEKEKAAALARYYKRKELAAATLSGRLTEPVDLAGAAETSRPQE